MSNTLIKFILLMVFFMAAGALAYKYGTEKSKAKKTDTQTGTGSGTGSGAGSGTDPASSALWPREAEGYLRELR